MGYILLKGNSIVKNNRDKKRETISTSSVQNADTVLVRKKNWAAMTPFNKEPVNALSKERAKVTL